MSWYEPEEDRICPDCHGEEDECSTCDGCGYVSRSEYREYIADARAEMDRD